MKRLRHNYWHWCYSSKARRGSLTRRRRRPKAMSVHIASSRCVELFLFAVVLRRQINAYLALTGRIECLRASTSMHCPRQNSGPKIYFDGIFRELANCVVC
ncbi:hypothetical protein SCHPADRAFT_742114 [Schizopora paradoxa]|uniref:Uncharacterized protein n=1 Tax=Schizopora paradoxa TaxID=27342 RepID=A0A0H2RJI7_9AGAM|nr:hypothetical protein SCHPADRAFT_742114 [Schizopora paradoxa]